MENNALQVDYTEWEAGKQYPEWMDEISLATVSPVILVKAIGQTLFTLTLPFPISLDKLLVNPWIPALVLA